MDLKKKTYGSIPTDDPDPQPTVAPDGENYKSVNPTEETAKSVLTCWTVTTVLYILLGNMAAGFCLGALNSPGVFIKEFMNQTSISRGHGQMSHDLLSELYGLLSGIYAVGAGISSVCTQKMADSIGRKRLIALSACVGVTSALLMGLCVEAGSYEMLFVGRVTSGLTAGVTFAIAPIYLAEVLPHRHVGAAMLMNNFSIGTGVLMASVMGFEEVFATEQLWPFIAASHGVPAVLQILLLPAVVSSPYYLIMKRQEHVATKALQRLRGTMHVKHELEKMLATTITNRTHGMSVIQLLSSSSFRRPLLVSTVSFVAQQFTGIVIVLFYTVDMLEKVGLSETNSRYVSAGVVCGGNLVTLVAAFQVHRLRRRFMLLAGIVGLFFCEAALSAALIFGTSSFRWLEYVGIACLPPMASVHAFGPAQVPWLLVTELFDGPSRGAASSVCTMVLWFSLFAVGYAFPPLQDLLGEYSVLPFVGLCAFFFVFFLILQPETVGRTLKEETITVDPPSKKVKLNRQDGSLLESTEC